LNDTQKQRSKQKGIFSRSRASVVKEYITYNSKQTYLAYRSAWKAEYSQISADIRLLRQAERYRQRKEFGHKVLREGEDCCLATANKLCGNGSYVYNRQTRKARATEMLAELKQAKLEAQRQYLARSVATSGVPPTEP